MKRRRGKRKLKPGKPNCSNDYGLGDLIRSSRVARNMQQSELADALGYSSKGNISTWELGTAQPTYECLQRVEKFFGAEPGTFCKLRAMADRDQLLERIKELEVRYGI